MKGLIGIIVGSLLMLMGTLTMCTAVGANLEDGPRAGLLVLMLGLVLASAGFGLVRVSRKAN